MITVCTPMKNNIYLPVVQAYHPWSYSQIVSYPTRTHSILQTQNVVTADSQGPIVDRCQTCIASQLPWIPHQVAWPMLGQTGMGIASEKENTHTPI